MTRPTDHSQEIMEAVIQKLLSSASLTTSVGDRVYGRRLPANPSWPYIRYGVPVTTPYEAQGWGGSDLDMTLHVFARGDDQRPCDALAKAVVAALSDDTLPLADGLTLIGLDWQRTQILEDDGEGGDYHAIINFAVTTAE